MTVEVAAAAGVEVEGGSVAAVEGGSFAGVEVAAGVGVGGEVEVAAAAGVEVEEIAPRGRGARTGTRGRRRAARRRPTGRRLFAFDRRLGFRYVAGADEAGRGSLAGPLVAAAVLFDYEKLTTRELRALAQLNDSKQHTPEAREELYPAVLRCAERVMVVSRCVRGIDERGLHRTNLAALRDALCGVLDSSGVAGCEGFAGEGFAREGSARAGFAREGSMVCLVDGFAVADVGCEQRPIVDGDATSAAIAAASIVAKVTRDRYMQRADELHPGWRFAEHVGYSTPEHREAIMRLGVSPLHRMSFQSLAYQQLAL